MALINYREIREHFCDIDAEFVRADLDLPGGSASYTVRLDSPWEDPAFQALTAVEQPRDVCAGRAARITVRIFARGVHACCLSPRRKIVDLAFSEDNPRLWSYHDTAQVFCTSPLTVDRAIELLDLVRSAVGQCGNPYHFLNVPPDSRLFYQWTASGSCSLGRFPLPLFTRVIAWLDAIGAQYFVPRQHEVRASVPSILFIDGEDYIIADDFELDVPQ